MDTPVLTYANFEKLPVPAPVDRLGYISAACRGKAVLDIGCLDETALVKRDTRHWLHGRIGSVADRVLGIDSSLKVPDEGLVTGPNSRIVRGDATRVDLHALGFERVDVVVAGELIEHIEHPLGFVREMKRSFAGSELLLSTPNGMSLSNTMMGVLRREVQHPDHLHNFTYKTLNTVCLRAGLAGWRIVPYHFYATEMILASSGLKRAGTRLAASCVRGAERFAPLLSFGYIVHARL